MKKYYIYCYYNLKVLTYTFYFFWVKLSDIGFVEIQSKPIFEFVQKGQGGTELFNGQSPLILFSFKLRHSSVRALLREVQKSCYLKLEDQVTCCFFIVSENPYSWKLFRSFQRTVFSRTRTPTTTWTRRVLMTRSTGTPPSLCMVRPHTRCPCCPPRTATTPTTSQTIEGILEFNMWCDKSCFKLCRMWL